MTSCCIGTGERTVIVRRGGPRHAYFGLLSVLAASVSSAGEARAFDFFGLFGEKPPPISANSLSYELSIKGLDDKTAATAINDVSILYRLRTEPPANGDELVRRAESDIPRIIDALWGAGYYAAKASIVIAGQTISLERPNSAAARAAADRLRGRSIAPVEIVVDPGPLYQFSDVIVIGRANGRPVSHAHPVHRRPDQAHDEPLVGSMPTP